MKKYLLPIFMTFTAIAGHAEFNSLVFSTLSGDKQSVGLTDLNITFADGEMRATSKGESVRIALTSLESMEFSDDMSGIESVSTEKLPQGKVTVYATDGQFQGSYDSATAALAKMPNGVYILKDENGITSKILIIR